jgi:hypothetical protein
MQRDFATVSAALMLIAKSAFERSLRNYSNFAAEAEPGAAEAEPGMDGHETRDPDSYGSGGAVTYIRGVGGDAGERAT